MATTSKQKPLKKRNKKDEATKLQGGTKKSMGDEPTLKGPQLKRELEKFHLELELQEMVQNQPETRNKNVEKQKLPNNRTEKNIMSETETSRDPQTQGNAPQQPHPSTWDAAARIDARGEQLLRELRYQSSTGRVLRNAAIGVGTVAVGTALGMGIVAGVQYIFGGDKAAT